ncbi:MAG: 6-phosphofructokinase [Chloroflexota bacterium]|nr:6-phosphofructokinase [Chloroflexota bacterium]
MRSIGILTSGGDSPGMNSFIRAAVRTGLYHGLRVYGIKRGFAGLLDDSIQEFDGPRDVSGILHQGGTILQTARCPEFKTEQGLRGAVHNVNDRDIDGLVVLGGSGSLRGCRALEGKGISVVAAPGTIDNDIPFTEMAIGVDTALNVVLQAIDRIRDTASSLERAFLVETMGRESGYLALMAGIAGGAEMICIPEIPFELEDVAEIAKSAYLRGKDHCIIIVAEGAAYNASQIGEYLLERREEVGFDVRTTILGHVQRGGAPTAFDRILATRMGQAAVELLMNGEHGVMVGLQGSEIVPAPLEEVISTVKELDLSLYGTSKIMER